MKVCFASITSSPVCTRELSEVPPFKDTRFSCRMAVSTCQPLYLCSAKGAADQGYFGLPMRFTLHFRIVADTVGVSCVPTT